MQVLGNATVIVQRFMVCTPFDKVEETMGRAQKDPGRKVTFKLPTKAVSAMKAVPSHDCKRLAGGGSALGGVLGGGGLAVEWCLWEKVRALRTDLSCHDQDSRCSHGGG